MPHLPRRTLIGSLTAAGMFSAARAQEMTPAPKPSFAGKRILVVGGTGRIGGHIIRRLLAGGAKVKAGSRNVDRAKKETPQVDWLRVDVKDEGSLKGIARGMDLVFCAIGAGNDPDNTGELVDGKGVAALAAEAKAAGAKQFILLSANSAAKPNPTSAEPFALLMRWKRQGEEAVEQSGVPYTIVRPTLLWDKPSGEYGIALATRPLAVNAMMSRDDVAAVMVQSATTEKALGKAIHCFNVASNDVYAWAKNFPRFADA